MCHKTLFQLFKPLCQRHRKSKETSEALNDTLYRGPVPRTDGLTGGTDPGTSRPLEAFLAPSTPFGFLAGEVLRVGVPSGRGVDLADEEVPPSRVWQPPHMSATSARFART